MATVRPATQAGSDLVRGLTLTHTTALAIGAVIGTGVFLKAATMAQLLGRPSLVQDLLAREALIQDWVVHRPERASAGAS